MQLWMQLGPGMRFCVQAGNHLSVKLMLSEEQANKFTNLDLVVVDRTNPLDEDNEEAFLDQAIAHCEGKDGHSLRLRFCLDEDGQAGNTKGRHRVLRMRRLLKIPMTGWCSFLLLTEYLKGAQVLN
jgi:hypothetical protein